MSQNKRAFLSFVGLLLLSIFVLNFASAYRFGFVGSIDSAIYQAQPVLEFFFGGGGMYTGYMLFEKILIFLLLLSVVFVVLKTMPLFKGDSQKKVLVLLSVIIPLLSVRYINYEWLNTIIMSYQVFGIALTSFLPFVIYFFFLIGIAPDHSSIRKVGWILFMCVYLGLYITADNPFYGQVYLWTALLAVVFFLIDGTIQNYMIKQKLKYGQNKSSYERYLRLKKDQERFYDTKGYDSSSYTYTDKTYIENLEKELKEIEKRVYLK